MKPIVASQTFLKHSSSLSLLLFCFFSQTFNQVSHSLYPFDSSHFSDFFYPFFLPHCCFSSIFFFLKCIFRPKESHYSCLAVSLFWHTCLDGVQLEFYFWLSRCVWYISDRIDGMSVLDSSTTQVRGDFPRADAS